MQFKAKYTLFGVGLALLIIAILGASFGNTAKTAYLDNIMLFNEFDGTKELKIRIQALESDYKTIADSLQIQSLALKEQYRPNKKNSDQQVLKIREKEFQILQHQQTFEQKIQTLNSAYTEQIWVQINQYVKEYCEKEELDYLFGASGNGSLMYAKSNYDLTQEIINYTNLRYAGK